MSTPVKLTSESPQWMENLPEQLARAVEDYNLPETEDWTELSELSQHTVFEGIEVHGDSIVVEKGTLVAPANVYVELNYDPKSKEPVSFADSYPARVFFNVKEGIIEILRIKVDTSSFYE